MKILVTGGAGFIGANFVQYMVEQYPADEIYNLDALTYAGNLESLEPVADRPNYHFVSLPLFFTLNCVILDNSPVYELHSKIHDNSVCCGTSDCTNTIDFLGFIPVAKYSAATSEVCSFKAFGS